MDHPRLTVVHHPLVRHKLTMMRDKQCNSTKFRRMMRELGLILAMEATKRLELGAPSPVASFADQSYEGQLLQRPNAVAVPILRGGLTLAEAFLDLMPMARTGHIGIFHDYGQEEPVAYLISVPSAPPGTDFFVMDGLLGTGKTLIRAVEILLGVGGITPDRITVMALACHEDGLTAFFADPRFAPIPVVTFETITERNDAGRAAFGFGNIGDRVFFGMGN